MTGLKDWFEIFKAGTHKDMHGNIKDWTTSDLDKMVSAFASDKAPCVIGHPKNTDPAFGWLGALKREGDKLFAKCSKVVPEFENAVREGLYPNRSICVDKNGNLLHLGFLGAKAPAVTDLEPIKFEKHDDDVVYEFEAPEVADNAANAEGEEQKPQDNEAVQADIKELQDKITQLQADNSTLKQKNETLSKTINDKELEVKKAQCEAFCANLMDKGVLTPVQKDYAMAFMEQISDTQTFCFAQQGEKTAVEHFKDFLKTLPVQVSFDDVAQPPKDISAFSEAETLARQAKEYKFEKEQKGESIAYWQAVKAVTKGDNK